MARLERKRLACRLPAQRSKRILRGRLTDDYTPYLPLQRAALHALAASETLALQSNFIYLKAFVQSTNTLLQWLLKSKKQEQGGS